MKIDIQIVITVVSSLVAGILGFFIAKNKLKDDINALKVEQERLKSRDNEQQIVIDFIKKQADELIPVLLKQLNKKNKKNKNGK